MFPSVAGNRIDWSFGLIASFVLSVCVLLFCWCNVPGYLSGSPLLACDVFFTFFVLDTKKDNKKKIKSARPGHSDGAATNTASRKDRDWLLLPYSFVALLCMVVSAFVILLFGLLQPKYRLVVSELWFTSFACLLFVFFFFVGVMCLDIQWAASLLACDVFFTFFVLDRKKDNKKKIKAATNTASRKDRDWLLLPYSFVGLLCMVVSAFVILLFGL
jgi:hypothetical protein